MVPHFEIVDEIFIQDDKSDNETMKKSTEYWRNVFKEWVNERNFQSDLEVYESDVLDKNTVAVSYIQKFSDFGLYVVNK